MLLLPRQFQVDYVEREWLGERRKRKKLGRGVIKTPRKRWERKEKEEEGGWDGKNPRREKVDKPKNPTMP